MRLCACFSRQQSSKEGNKPIGAVATQQNGAAPGGTATPLDRVSPESFASANSFASAQSFLWATSNMTGTSSMTTPGGSANAASSPFGYSSSYCMPPVLQTTHLISMEPLHSRFAGGVADRSSDGLAGLSPEHQTALEELRRRVAAPQTTDAANGDTASLAERLRSTGEVVDDACLRRCVVRLKSCRWIYCVV